MGSVVLDLRVGSHKKKEIDCLRLLVNNFYLKYIYRMHFRDKRFFYSLLSST